MGRCWRGAMLVLLTLAAQPAAAQDIPGLETCMAEKQIDRRTGCLQSNDDFLQRSIAKLERDMRARIAASSRELAAAQSEIAALKAAVEKLNGELAQMKGKAEPAGKK